MGKEHVIWIPVTTVVRMYMNILQILCAHLWIVKQTGRKSFWRLIFWGNSCLGGGSDISSKSKSIFYQAILKCFQTKKKEAWWRLKALSLVRWNHQNQMRSSTFKMDLTKSNVGACESITCVIQNLTGTNHTCELILFFCTLGENSIAAQKKHFIWPRLQI